MYIIIHLHLRIMVAPKNRETKKCYNNLSENVTFHLILCKKRIFAFSNALLFCLTYLSQDGLSFNYFKAAVDKNAKSLECILLSLYISFLRLPINFGTLFKHRCCYWNDQLHIFLQKFLFSPHIK